MKTFYADPGTRIDFAVGGEPAELVFGKDGSITPESPAEERALERAAESGAVSTTKPSKGKEAASDD